MSPYFLQQPKFLLENNSESNDNDDNYDMKDNELNLTNRNDEASNNSEEEDYREQNPIQAAVRLPDRTAEAIENEVARAHDLVDLELSGHGFKRSPQAAGVLAHSQRRGSFYTNMPPGIKSAIVASATIVLTALITFMVIFGVCKWKQRRHRMTNIMKSYNAMKSKLPTIAAATSSSAALSANGGTNPNSRRSSFREMQDLLGGSGLSVAATITTTSTGVPNTPIHTTKTSSNPLNATAQQTTTLMAAAGGQCSKNLNSSYGHSANNSNSGSSNNSNSNSCGIRPLQRQSSLLFQRSFNHNINNSNSNSNNNEKPTNLSILSGCNLLDLKRNSKMSGSTTSLSFSLTSGHNISNSHINTMDANSPEVQEYLFDTLRNSF